MQANVYTKSVDELETAISVGRLLTDLMRTPSIVAIVLLVQHVTESLLYLFVGTGVTHFWDRVSSQT